MKQTTAGFTLIEVLVAMVIFALSSLAVSSLMVGSMAQVSKNRHRSEAVRIAQEELEQMRSIQVADMANATSTSESARGGVTFAITRTVTRDSPVTGVNTINVTVSWTHKGVSQSYAAKTMFTQITRS